MSKTNSDVWHPTADQTKRVKKFIAETTAFYDGIKKRYPNSAIKIIFDVGYIIVDGNYLAWCKTTTSKKIQHALQIKPTHSWTDKLVNKTMLQFVNEYNKIAKSNVVDIKIDQPNSMITGLRTVSSQPLITATDLLKKVLEH